MYYVMSYLITHDGRTELEVTRFFTVESDVLDLFKATALLNCGLVFYNGFDPLPTRGFFTLAEVEGRDYPYIVDIVETDEQKVE